MGNCIFAGKKLFSQCYNHFGQSGKSSPEFDCLIGKALSHSHSPLVFDDSVSRSSISSHFDESSIPISSSWVSDGARSDASHILYKELDPLNRTTSVELDKECGATFYKEGSWITVAEPSNGKYASSSSISHYIMPTNTEQTSASMHRDDKRSMIHPLVEEVDGLELARLARRLWNQNKTKYGKSACFNEKVGIKSHSKPTYLERPTVLRLRSTPQTVLPPVTKPTVSKDIYFESPDMDSAFDLAWDHEMDLNIFNTEVRRPYNKHVPQCNISPDFDNESHTNQFATRSRLFDAKKKSMTAVSIHDSSFSQTPSVTILPVRNDNLNADNRWVSSDRLPGNARSTTKKPITSETAIPCSDLFVSPTYNVDLEYSTTSKVTPRLAFHDNLFDSGFVGGSGGSNMISSFSDFDDTDEKVIGVDKREPADNLTTDLPTDHSNDFLWEHELFIPPMCCKTKEVRCPTTV